jgi:uncharacterized cupredoxin-like copper-binding protein
VSGPGGHRGTVVAALVAAVALLVGGATAVALGDGGTIRSLDGASAVPGCTAPALPGTTVAVEVTDRGSMGMGRAPMQADLMASPTSVPAGKVSFVVANTGAQVHELVVLPLPADGLGSRPVAADGTIDESQSLGEASRSCGAGTGEGIDPGSTGWATVTLTPGRYELVCNLPWHYAAGMYAVLTVT